MVDGGGLVVVVVVDVQAGVRLAPLGDEVDQLLEGGLLPGPVERPELPVPGPSRLVGVGGVDDAEEVLEAELLAVVAEMAGPSMSKNKSPSTGSGSARSPRLATSLPSSSRSGSTSS